MKSDSYYQNGENLSFVPRTHDEERALFTLAKAGNEAAKEKLIRDHLLLVAGIARRLANGKLPENEVISAANFALMKAFENFKPESATRFSGFITLYVRGEIARLWHDQNIVSKGDFSDGEPVTAVPLNDETPDENSSGDPDHHSFLIKLLRESKGILTTREQKIIDMIYNENPMSQSDVARALKVTRERIRQIHDVAVAKVGRELRRRMNENGINQ